ncbi:MAG: exodeoxyribonuclease VII large subunit [Nitrospirae bacterium]|nr:exodeoxyribonuclease VII large subunit [Nitrospirota bacterium]
MPVTVSELTRNIKTMLESGFPDVWVSGEITNLRIPSSGHIYLTLKDRDAQIKAVFFRQSARFLKFVPEDGLEVTVRGHLSVYELRGEYQIIVEYMEPRGLGALQLAFLQLKEKLEKEGLFDPARKRPLPRFPKRVGVVTSPTGAAVRDILKVLRRRAPGVQVVIAPASVQGEAAPAEIAKAIADLNGLGGLDVMIVGRGGGSIEDLAAFNTEAVARAIAASGIPVISAVGHETDFTIADFVSDLRAPTPSAAAEIVARSEEELKDALENMGRRMVYSVGHRLKLLRSRLDSEARALPDIRRTVREKMQRVDDFSARLARGAAYDMRSRRDRLSGIAARLDTLSPLAPLSRGFAVATALPGGEVVRSAGRLSPGDRLRLRFIDGEADCRVEDTTANSGS